MQGSGSNQAEGLSAHLKKTGGFNYLVGSGGTTIDTFSFGDIVKTYSLLPSQYQNSSSWVIRPEVLNQLFEFGEDNPNPWFKFNEATASSPGSVGTLLGRPVYVSSRIAKTLDLTGLTANKSSAVILGDFTQYYLAEWGQLEVDTSTDFKFQEDKTCWRAKKHFGGKVAFSDAFVFLGYQAAS